MSNQQRVSRGIPTGGQFSTTSRQESGVTLTAPARKRDRRGTHFTVTLPDGTVATRASQASTYSHVVAASAEKPELVIRERSLRVSESVARIEVIDRVIANPDIKMRHELVSRGWEGGTDPQGRKHYGSCRAVIEHPDGTQDHPLAAVYCDSSGTTQGVRRDDGSYDSLALQSARDALLAQLKRERAKEERTAKNALRDIARVEAGTYPLEPAKVERWSSREDAALKAVRGFDGPHQTREIMVLPVDEP
ncbi:hypothetical protein [Arthrobacter sp. CP30]